MQSLPPQVRACVICQSDRKPFCKHSPVQWTGRPNAAVILHKEDWGTIPFSLLWGGFAIFWLLGASGIGNFWTNRPDKTFQWLGVIWGTPFVLSIHDLGPLCLQLLEETANLLRAHHTAGAHSCKWFQGPHSIKCLLREHDDHRQVGSPRRHW